MIHIHRRKTSNVIFQDDIRDFLKIHCSSASDNRQLHPVKLVDVNDVDLSLLRSPTLFSENRKLSKPNILNKSAEKKPTAERCSLNDEQIKKPKIWIKRVDSGSTLEKNLLVNEALKCSKVISCKTGDHKVNKTKIPERVEKMRIQQRYFSLFGP